MLSALLPGMAQTLDDLLIWKKALEFWEAINPLLGRPGFGKDRDLHDQIRDAIDSVLSNISEGFEQPTDRAFARYLYYAKASAAEVRSRIYIAWRRDYISTEDYLPATTLGTELCKMLAGFIKYLYRCNRKQRGVGPPPPSSGKPAASPPRHQKKAAVDADEPRDPDRD